MSIYSFIQKITSRLPIRGLPILLRRLPCSPSATAAIQVGDIQLRLRLNNSVMRNIYFGAFEKHIQTLLRDFLVPGDIFIDVGANIGFLSAYARTLVGPRGQVHCFEPVPEFAGEFSSAVADSGSKNVFVNPCAVGAAEGYAELQIAGESNIGWNTIVPGFMKDSSRTISVPVVTLSKYFQDKNLSDVKLIKIDVEGAEWLVLNGLSQAFSRGIRPTIICETSPEGCSRLGISLVDVFKYMQNNGYAPFRFRRSGIYKIYTGKAVLDPIVATDIVHTDDVVWLPR